MLMPPTCDGCGAAFTLSYALDCQKGGLVVKRHNEIRDALADLACLAYKEVIREPVVRDGDADGLVSLLILVCVGCGSLKEKLYSMCVLLILMPNRMFLVLLRMFWLMPKRRKNESIDWLLRLAMLPFRLLSSMWMVPWVKRLLYFWVVSLISFLLPGVEVTVMFLGGLRLVLALR